MQYTIAYVSHVSPGVTDDNLRTLLEISELNNNKKNISGVLLYSEGNFFQVIEGDKGTILELFKKIKSDKRHEAIITILKKSIDKRTSSCYKAEFVDKHKNDYQYIATDYLDCIQSLEHKSQSIVRGIIKNFIS